MSGNDELFTEEAPAYASFFGIIGATFSMTMAAAGSAYATAKAGIGIAAMAQMAPESVMKALIPVVMAGIVAIYGLVVSVIISQKIDANMTLFAASACCAAGLSVGVSGMAAGYAIGIVGDIGVRTMASQPKVFVGMVLTLIFAEVLGLYGLIVGLLMATRI